MSTPAWEVVQGDCLDVMGRMREACVDSIVTDPPYGLAFMGKHWDHGVPGADFWREALRVAKPGAHLLAFGGTRTFHRLAVAIEDAGWEVRDQIAWIYSTGFPKSHNLDGDREGWGTALKPAMEPICVARKPLVGTVARNVETFGTGALNIDGTRIGTSKAVPASPKKVGASVHTVSLAGGSGDTSGFNPNIGRWPANVVHDGSDEVLAGFPQSKSTGGSASLGAFRNGDVYGRGRDEVEKRDPGFGDSGSAARFFYCAKASRSEREAGLREAGLREAVTTDGREKPIDNPFLRGETLRKNTHPTVKPVALMRWLCRLVTPPGGIVLDPFTGSGTTGVAAVQEGFRFIGIEREAQYVEIARARIANAVRP